MRVLIVIAICLPVLTAQADPASCPGAPTGPAPTVIPRQVLQDRLADGIDALAFSPDGEYLAAATGARSARVWDVRHHAVVANIRRPEILPPWSVAWSPDPDRLVLGQHQAILVDVAHDTNVGAFTDEAGNPTGEWVRRIPGNAATPYVGVHYTDVALFDAKRKVAALFAWPGRASNSDVNTLAVSASGKIVAGAGDTSLFVWSVAQPAVPAKRFPLAGTHTDALALSPDGTLAVVAVHVTTATGKLVVIATADGAIRRELSLPEYATGDAPKAVAISRDGKLVAAGSLHALAVWDIATGALRWRSDAATATVRGASTWDENLRAVEFSPTSMLLAAGNARGNVFLYDGVTGRQVAELGAGVRRPSSIRFLRDGSLVAVSARAVARWSPAQAVRLESRAAVWPVLAAEAPDGQVVVARSPAFGGAACPDGNPIYVQDLDTLEVAHAEAVARGLARKKLAPALPSSPDPLCFPGTFELADLDGAAGRALVDARSAGALGVVSIRDGKRTPLVGSDGFLFARAFSADGARVVATDLTQAVVWDARSGKQLGTFKTDANATSAVLSGDGAQVAVLASLLMGGAQIVVFDVATGKRAWTVDLGAIVMAMAFRAGTHDVVVGTYSGELGVFHAGKLAFSIASPFGAIGLAVSSPDGKLIATMHQDGAIRLWDLDARIVRASLIDYEDEEWAIITPGGAFTGTSEVASRIGWVFDAPLEAFGFEQFAATFRQPELVKRRLRGEAVDASPAIPRPPVVAIASAKGSPRATVRVHAKSGSRVDSVWLFREGRPLDHKALCKPEGDVTFDVPLLAGVDHIEITAVDDRGFSSNPASIELVGTGATRPDVWVVAVGVSKYPNLAPEEQLHVADADALAIGAVFAAQAGPRKPFAASHVTTLVNEQVTVDSVRAALAALDKMRPDDLAILFFAGHGVELTPSSGMRFLTHQTALSDASILQHGLGWSEVSDRIDRMRGRVVLLLDACHAGHLTQDVIVPNGALANGLVRAGRAGAIVFAASKGRQESLEVGAHGVFTQALLDSLAARDTDHDRDGAIQMSEAIDAITLRVEHATAGEQTPWVARREIFGDFQLAATPK